MNDTNRCCVTVFGTGPYAAFNKSSCSKPVKVTVDGKHYCATHSPDAVAKRRAASDAKHKAELGARNKAHEARKTEQHKAACFDELVQALDKLVKRGEWTMEKSPTHDGLANCDALAQARRALDKARNV